MSAAVLIGGGLFVLWSVGCYLLGRRDGLGEAIRTLRGGRGLP